MSLRLYLWSLCIAALRKCRTPCGSRCHQFVEANLNSSSKIVVRLRRYRNVVLQFIIRGPIKWGLNKDCWIFESRLRRMRPMYYFTMLRRWMGDDAIHFWADLQLGKLVKIAVMAKQWHLLKGCICSSVVPDQHFKVEYFLVVND